VKETLYRIFDIAATRKINTDVAAREIAAEHIRRATHQLRR
jgi:hypothetical protein